MKKRKRHVSPFPFCPLSLIIFPQPYIEQAARDKERAEQAKADYDVTNLSISSSSNLISSLQGKAGGSGGENDEEE